MKHTYASQDVYSINTQRINLTLKKFTEMFFCSLYYLEE